MNGPAPSGGVSAGGDITWSVVITTFNRPELLRRAIERCLAQSEPCEVVVVDDCSTDDTQAVVAAFPQVVYRRNRVNRGHAPSANLGIASATGSWIKHLDDDDYLHPDCLRVMTSAILDARARGYDPRIVTCVSNNVDLAETMLSATRTLPVGKRALIAREKLLPLMMLDQVPLGTPVQVGHDRQAAIAAGGWNEDSPIKFRNGDEAEFWIRLAAQGDALFLPDALAYRTIWSGNERPAPTDHLAISLYLKTRILALMTGADGHRVPPDIARYLALHWGLVALRDRKIPAAVKLTLRGMFHLASYRHLWRRSRFADAIKYLHVLD